MKAPNILVVDDEQDIRTLIDEILSDEGYSVVTAGDGSEARARMSSTSPDLVLLDIWMPDIDGISLLTEWNDSGETSCPVVVMSGHGTVETAVEATRLGAVDFVEKPLSLQKLLRTVERALESDRRRRYRAGDQALPGLQEPLGKSRKIQALRQAAASLAEHPAPALLIGEPGSGRAAVARYMHSVGPNPDAPFVKLVSAAVADENAASQLYGSVASGQGSAPGFLAQAGSGMLFINSVEALCPSLQRLLLGALESGSYCPVGATEQQPVRCRMLAALKPETWRDPKGAGVSEALIERLGSLHVAVPALREHPEDISDLLRQFVERLVETEELPYRRFAVPAQNRLRNYPWPGNLDELKRLVRRVLLAEGPEEVGLAEIEAMLVTAEAPSGPLVKQDLLSLPLREAREQFERAYLMEQLKLSGGKVGQLAKRVGMERTHLYRKLRSLGINFRNIADD